MKKVIFIVAALLFFGVLFSGNAAKATGINTVESGYYVVKPKLVSNLQVNAQFKLSQLSPGFEKFEFFYLPAKKSYIINDQYGFRSVKWNGGSGVGNLVWANQNVDDENMLWVLEKVNESQVVIHNKKNQNMVWDIHNYTPNLNAPVKLEKNKPFTSIYKDAQIFNLTTS